MSGSEVLIIGGGVIGCTSALRLAQAGARVAIVERGACGRETSWAASGIIDPGSLARADPIAELRRASISMYPPLIAELRDQTGIDPQYVACGGLDLITDDNQDAAADREVAAAAGRSTAAGDPIVERLSTPQAVGLEPNLTRDIRGALLKRTVAQVRSPRLMAALRAACIQAGVRLIEETPVLDLLCEGARVIGVQTATGPLHAGCVVLAAGSWSARIGERLARVIEVYPVRGQIVLLEQMPRPFSHVIEHGTQYLICRLDGRILVGSTLEHDAGFDKRNTATAVGMLLRFAERFMPVLKDATLVQAWAGLRPGTRDGRPYIGPVPGFDGLIAATGHYRSGLILAPLTAQAIVDYIARGDVDPRMHDFLPASERGTVQPKTQGVGER